jgi:hypothetical protein
MALASVPYAPFAALVGYARRSICVAATDTPPLRGKCLRAPPDMRRLMPRAAILFGTDRGR